MPYEPKEYGTVEVCGANTEMLVFLRGRCEDYVHYTDSVGKCTGAVTDDGCDTTSPEQNHWLEAAQSYSIIHCGAGRGREDGQDGSRVQIRFLRKGPCWCTLRSRPK